MPVTQTSKDAYIGVELRPLQEKVVMAIQGLGESCIADIAAYLNMERSTVAARVNELKKMNILFFTGLKKSNRTNITSEHYRLRMPGDPIETIQEIPVRKEISEAGRVLASARGMKQTNQQPTLW